MQSIISVLANVFSGNAAPVATSAMRDLTASEVSVVAGAPELGHDVVTFAKAAVAIVVKP